MVGETFVGALKGAQEEKGEGKGEGVNNSIVPYVEIESLPRVICVSDVGARIQFWFTGV